MPKHLKTIRSYTGLARYMATLQTKPSGRLSVCGYMADRDMPARAKYSYSPSRAIYRDSQMRAVAWIETAHKVYEVWCFDDAPDWQITTESEAEARQLAA
jgi:hypothetical protein